MLFQKRVVCIKFGIYVFISSKLHIQYWCIDSKYRIYVAMLRNGGKTSYTRKTIFRSERVYYKTLSSQCNLTTQIEGVQEEMS